MTITPGPSRRSRSDEGDIARAYADPPYAAQPPAGQPAADPGPERRGAAMARRLTLVGIIIVAVVIFTGTQSVRTAWGHRLHDLTGGSWGADYVVGLAIGLLPLLGVALAAFLSRRAGHGRVRRAMRMFTLGGAGFIATYLLSPSPARAITDHTTTRLFEHATPGYLPAVYTGVGIWVVVFVVALLRARAWWRRVRSTPRSRDRKVVDI